MFELLFIVVYILGGIPTGIALSEERNPVLVGILSAFWPITVILFVLAAFNIRPLSIFFRNK